MPVCKLEGRIEVGSAPAHDKVGCEAPVRVLPLDLGIALYDQYFSAMAPYLLDLGKETLDILVRYAAGSVDGYQQFLFALYLDTGCSAVALGRTADGVF